GTRKCDEVQRSRLRGVAYRMLGSTLNPNRRACAYTNGLVHRAEPMLRSASAFVLSLALAMPLAASGKHGEVAIKEWPVPWANTHPSDPHVQSPERVWFVSESGNYLASFNPQTQRFSKLELSDEPAPRALVVAAGAKGMVWYTSSAHEYIGRYDPV